MSDIDTQKKRAAVDSMARRIQVHAKQSGDKNHSNFETARRVAVETAKRRDRKDKE